MAGGSDNQHDEEDEDLAAACWVTAIEQGLEPERIAMFHAWLAAHPNHAERVAQQAMLQDLARQAGKQSLANRANEHEFQARRRFLVGGAMATGAAALGAAAFFMNPSRLAVGRVGSSPDAGESYETASDVKIIELADDSRLWLDARTRVSASLTRDRRDLVLAAGRLFVEVAHNPERPFRVHAAEFEARAVGTAFEVTVFADRVGVAVTEGVVRLTQRAAGSFIDLGAGQSAWRSAEGEFVRTNAFAKSIGAWREQRMVLSDRRLDAALAELSRYYDRPLVVTDQQLATRRISLSFSIADLSAEHAARIIANAVGATIADGANAGILLAPAASAGAKDQPPGTP